MKITLVICPIKQQQYKLWNKAKERHQKKLNNLVMNKGINDGIQKNTSQAITNLSDIEWTKWWQNCSVETWFKTWVIYQKLHVTVCGSNRKQRKRMNDCTYGKFL